MVRKRIRFIEAHLTPTNSTGGWIVPAAYSAEMTKDLSCAEMNEALTAIGLTEGVDFRIIPHRYHTDANMQSKALKRVVFDEDEKFILAKMAL